MAKATVALAADVAEFQAAIESASKSLTDFSEKMGGETSKHANKMAEGIKSSTHKMAEGIKTSTLKIGESFDEMTKKLSSDGLGANAATEALAAGLGKLTGINISPVVELVDKVKDNLLALDRLSTTVGMSAGKITELKDAMEEAGVPTDKLEDQLTSLSRAIGQARSGSSEAKEAFAKLGISTAGWSKHLPPLDDVLLKLADHIKHSKTPAQDLAAATKLLGANAQQLIPFLRQGSAAIREQMNAHLAHGQAVDASIDDAKDLQREEASLAEQIQLLLLPAFHFLVKALQLVIAGVIKWKAVFENVGYLVAGIVRGIIDEINLLSTVIQSAASHWKDILHGNFSAVASDAQASFKKMQSDMDATFAKMTQNYDEADKKADAVFAQQPEVARRNDDHLSGIVRTGERHRLEMVTRANKDRISHAQQTGQAVQVDWQQTMRSMGKDTKAESAVLSSLMTGIPAALPPALAKLNSQTRQIMQSVAHNMASAFSSAIKGMIDGTQTLGQAFANMGRQMVSSLESSLEKMLESWVEHHAMQVLVHVAAKGEEVAADDAAASQKEAIGTREHLHEVARSAADAAAGAYKAMAGIPVIGPVLGAAAAAATFSAVMAFSSLTSAAGGFYEVDSDQLAFIHRREMVLPAGIADRLRNTIEAGGGEGNRGVHIHLYHSVNAIDSASFKDTIRQHGQMIGDEVARVLRRRAVRG
jgi:hypothetical protein